MLCCAALYERICTLPFPLPPPSFFSYACMHAWLGFSGTAAVAAAIDVVFVFMEREEFKKKKKKGDGRGRLDRGLSVWVYRF